MSLEPHENQSCTKTQLSVDFSVFRVGNLPGNVQEATGNFPVILGQMGAQVDARTLGNSTA